MSRLEHDIERDLRQIADRATPSPDAWASIQQRIADQDPTQETEIIMLMESTLKPRRWPLVAAAAAVAALVVGGIALVNRDDDGTVPANEPEPVPVPAPAIEPFLIGSTTGASTLFPDSGNGGYEVSVYDWDLALSDDLTSLTGVATITATATQDLQRFSLDARDLQIESVTVDGTTAEFSVIEPELVITALEPLAAGSEFVVEVVYAAEPAVFKPSGTDWRGWAVVPGDQVYVEGYGPLAATWTPVDADADAPPARYIMRLDVPDGFTATASGIPTEAEETGDTVWDTGIGVFGATFAVADFETNVVEGAVPVEVSVKQGSQNADRIETQVLEFLPFLESLFGPFPYERLGISTQDGELTQAIQYSTPMRIVMAETTSDLLLLNLLATQWAGNAVTTTAETSWLHWGLTEYAEALWIESAGDDNDIDATTSRLTIRMPPTTSPLDDVGSIEELYDDEASQRAVLFYHALRLKIGDDAFLTTIREYIQRNLNTITGVEDLQAVAEEISEQDLDRFFTAWVSEPEVPQLPDTAQQ